ncbi:VOC family protein, partial [Vibrio parahaemolyticus]
VRPRIFIQKVPEPKVAKNRLHIDINVSGGHGVALEERKVGVDAVVARLKALGATDARGAIVQGGDYWVGMNDPEGNEFCVQ